MAARREQPYQRSHDSIAHSPGLIGEKRDRKKGLRGRELQVGSKHANVMAKANAGAMRQHGKAGRQECRDRDGGEDKKGPYHA